jgi:DNA-binding HxlR family transcriptional regulator
MKAKGSKGKRSDCPVNFAVETLGDKWSLVILRDIIFWGKRSYGEFLKSDEKIATNILAGRLEYLEGEGLIEKIPHATDKRKEVYNVTELGLDLVPMFLEMIAWSAQHECWQTLDHRHATKEQIRFVERTVNTKNKAKLIEDIKRIVRDGGCVFEGVVRPDTVTSEKD